jgi:hypothetical protein
METEILVNDALLSSGWAKPKTWKELYCFYKQYCLTMPKCPFDIICDEIGIGQTTRKALNKKLNSNKLSFNEKMEIEAYKRDNETYMRYVLSFYDK